MARFTGRVALITGAGRGQGRSHALALAREGAAVVLCDVPESLATPPYPMASAEDLHDTAASIERIGGSCLALPADVRDRARMDAVVAETLSTFGRLDICIANAAIHTYAALVDMEPETWEETLQVNLTGVFHTLRAALPPMIERRWGRIVTISSMAGKAGFPRMSHYCATKWGLIGLTKSVAREVAGAGITANVICSTAVDTPMIHNEDAYRSFAPGVEHPTRDDMEAALSTALNEIPVSYVSPDDISNAVLFLCSDEARHITGETLAVAAGQNARNSG